MRGSDRRSAIEDLLRADGRVTVDELAGTLSVTASTIRRDLQRLTAEGKITRTYGGAVTPAHEPERTLHERESLAQAQKDAIGRWAADQIDDGETVILDAGTTVGRLAHRLAVSGKRVTAITNGLTSLGALADADDVDVMVLGGELRHISQGFIGPFTEMMLRRLTADRVFLGADGLDARLGLCEASSVQTRLKELMMAQAREIYVLADSAKLGHAPFDRWAPLDRPWTLVTDAGAGDRALDPFRAQPGVTVVLAPMAVSVVLDEAAS